MSAGRNKNSKTQLRKQQRLKARIRSFAKWQKLLQRRKAKAEKQRRYRAMSETPKDPLFEYRQRLPPKGRKPRGVRGSYSKRRSMPFLDKPSNLGNDT